MKYSHIFPFIKNKIIIKTISKNLSVNLIEHNRDYGLFLFNNLLLLYYYNLFFIMYIFT